MLVIGWEEVSIGRLSLEIILGINFSTVYVSFA